MTTPLPTVPAGPPAASCRPAGVGIDAELPAERIAEIAKALAEPVRVRILDVLRRNPVAVCQCELIALFDIPQPTLSHHLRKLADAGLVTVERRHRWAYYAIVPDALQELSACLT